MAWGKDYNSYLARILREARLRAELTAYEAARLSGISKNYLHELECGVKRNPSVETILAMERTYRISIFNPSLLEKQKV